MDRVHDFGGLINHSQRGANRSISTAFAHHHFAGAANAHTRLGHVVHKGHKSPRRLLVWQGHHRLIDWQTACLDQSSAARRDAEDVGVLTSACVGHEEAGEVGIHASVQHFAPSSRDGVGRVAKDMQEAKVIEAHARHKSVLNEVLTAFRKLSGVFVVIANN